jgi:hypothetical protein
VIRTVALGVVCLAGLGAIAAAAKKSTPPSPSPEVVFPVVVGNKTDRLPIRTKQDTLTDTDKVDVVYVPPTGQDRIHLPQPTPQEAAGPPSLDIIPRHWHDPHNRRAEAAKPRTSSMKPSKKHSPDSPPKQVNAVKECRSDGLQPLLRKLNLSPPCDS